MEKKKGFTWIHRQTEGTGKNREGREKQWEKSERGRQTENRDNEGRRGREGGRVHQRTTYPAWSVSESHAVTRIILSHSQLLHANRKGKMQTWLLIDIVQIYTPEKCLCRTIRERFHSVHTSSANPKPYNGIPVGKSTHISPHMGWHQRGTWIIVTKIFASFKPCDLSPWLMFPLAYLFIDAITK